MDASWMGLFDISMGADTAFVNETCIFVKAKDSQVLLF